MKLKRPIVIAQNKVAAAKVAVGDARPKRTDDARDRMLELVKAEFSRLMHSVDDAKARATADELDIVAKILACSYGLIDSRKTP